MIFCDQRYGKVEEVLEKVRNYLEKLERKVKEVVEQNVAIKIQADSMKTKQAYHERQMSQMTSLITSHQQLQAKQ
jgi:regulator of replication initiation timing